MATARMLILLVDSFLLPMPAGETANALRVRADDPLTAFLELEISARAKP